jgi:hypothetical protein
MAEDAAASPPTDDVPQKPGTKDEKKPTPSGSTTIGFFKQKKDKDKQRASEFFLRPFERII